MFEIDSNYQMKQLFLTDLRPLTSDLCSLPLTGAHRVRQNLPNALSNFRRALPARLPFI